MERAKRGAFVHSPRTVRRLCCFLPTEISTTNRINQIVKSETAVRAQVSSRCTSMEVNGMLTEGPGERLGADVVTALADEGGPHRVASATRSGLERRADGVDDGVGEPECPAREEEEGEEVEGHRVGAEADDELSRSEGQSRGGHG